MSVQQRFKQFIVENFYVSDPQELQPDTSLITSGYVDSTGMLEVIAFLEEEFGIQIRDEEMVPENLETIARVEAFIARKRQAAANR
jgi:acyl carrier protein